MVGLTCETARFNNDIAAFYRQGEFETPLYTAAHNDPWGLPFLADRTKRQFNVAAARPLLMIENASRVIGQGSRRSLLNDPVATEADASKEADALEQSLAKLQQMGVVKGPVPSTAGVPGQVRQAAALVLSVAARCHANRQPMLGGLDSATLFKAAMAGLSEPTGVAEETAALRAARSVDMRYLYAAAQDLASAVEVAATGVNAVNPTTKYDFRLETTWGRIVLTGGSDSSHQGGANLLTIDTGGNDTYLNCPANASPENWLSVVIDNAGDDKYLSDPALAETPLAQWPARKQRRDAPGPGCAAAGIVFLFDARGNDRYVTHRPGIGAASFGVAFVRDQEGEDVYSAYKDGIGFARFGIGVVDDLAGNDRYEGFTEVQGVGLTQGFGGLFDRAGNDEYIANDTVLDFPSPQSAEHNVSMAQGAGYGYRGDYVTGHSLSGGVGWLQDQAGDDRYSCGVFGQGVGYWEGVGLLFDDGGNDEYKGQWYVQGASAHFGIGYLEDAAGNDRYVAPLNMAQGAGHDFGIGFLFDHEGDDVHEAPNLSLGAGNANGIGIFLDMAGVDVYNSRGVTLGASSDSIKASLRERAISIGLFIDAGGQRDTYPEAVPWARDSSRSGNWNAKGGLPRESQLGVFVDK
ncbi:MAG: hypothetical protein KIT11_08445 [Fimbriimonadaceae bacterium]|nr:hypothetical protein [Fimbriimonadaceae bacterium]QYK56382.1 MAG: hypothetical protein KF733_02640 [Fimbriimonadaceae bacterium]